MTEIDVRDALIHVLTERITELEVSIEHQAVNSLNTSLFAAIRYEFRCIAREYGLGLEYSGECYNHWQRLGRSGDLSVFSAPVDTGPFTRKYTVVATGTHQTFRSQPYHPGVDYEEWIRSTIENARAVLFE
jgi:hypothetical protein